VDKSEVKIGFIGAGVLGKGLAMALADKGYLVAAAHSRNPESARGLAGGIAGCRVAVTGQELADAADLVFITTPDSVIAQVAEILTWRTGQGVVHCCGAFGPEILAPAARQGAAIGAFHPFQTFAGLTGPAQASARLAGVSFAVAGEGWLGDFLRTMSHGLGGRPVVIPEGDRPLYHASAVLSCGHLAALLQSTVDLWTTMGFTAQEAIDALSPLARATLENIAKDGIPDSVTGPAVRGDAGTIRTHLAALEQRLPELAPLYRALTAASLPLAHQRGVAPEELAAIEALVQS
jgi:predicted short-subunit dehydrogenase-like oxidoreductase (DUF2520 family)